MRSTFTWDLLWFLSIATQVVLLGAIVWRRLGSKFPSLLWYCIASLAVDAFIAATRSTYRIYFFTYWGWMLVAAFFRLWILADVVGSFRGVGFIGRKIRIGIAGFAAIVGVVAGIITAHDPGSFGKRLVHACFVADRTIAYAWGGFILATLFSIWILRIGWHRTGALIANGLVVKMAGSIVGTSLLSFLHQTKQFSNLVIPTTSIVCYTIWIFAIITHTDGCYANLSNLPSPQNESR